MASRAGGFDEGSGDRELMARYYAMFLRYSRSRLVNEVRNEIDREVDDAWRYPYMPISDRHFGADLRPDAAHLLLVMADQMLIRPYWSFPPLAERQAVSSPPRMRREEIRQEILHSLGQILQELDRMDAPRPRSSHSVLKAIEKIWEPLALKFGWS